MGNAQLTSGATPAAGAWRRPVLYAAGTISMLVLTMAASLALWVLLPWAVLGWSPTLVTSGSMAPAVASGDVAIVRPVGTTADSLVAGTVVLYDRPETGRVLHRIVDRLPDGSYQTRGDANADPDTVAVRPADIKGVAVLAVPLIGTPSQWLRSGSVLKLVLAGACLTALLLLAPRAFDPAFDPWASGGRIAPAQVLLTRSVDDVEDASTDGQLLPPGLSEVVFDRLAGHSRVTQARAVALLAGLP